MNLLLSIGALILTLGILSPSLTIFKRWAKGDEEERHELEKTYYLTFSAVIIILGIRLFLVPLYFWAMQMFVPMIPGAMCLWGVFEAIPDTTWSALLLKLVLPVAYLGWLLLSRIDASSKTHPLMRNMMAFFILISPLVLLDSTLDILTFARISPVQVNCCSDAIDVWTRPVPGIIAGVSGQTVLVGTFFVLAAVFAAALYLSLKHRSAQRVALALSIPVGVVLVLAVTEVFTPWLLNLPFHHCPFCLYFLHPLSTVFTALLWFALASPWLVLIIQKFGVENEESRQSELRLERTILTYSSISTVMALTIIAVDLLVAFA